ncbi:related to cytochrome P450 8B1 [Rhynchosporium secalis]|uniref:Related to cytochrome P450 8B1 n=1 Tax=Rhynchosporium secalis TaxID=38038 RepID=A0A1E1MKI6_RHYSE|nr:related to cytochrome P450 8B1 [Rhynchosporium secalis]
MSSGVERGSSFTASLLKESRGSMILPTAIVAVLGILVLASRRLGGVDENEPPLMTSRIPFCGHLLDTTPRNASQSLSEYSSKFPSYPAFTLRIFSSRIYVICDPSLVQAAYRNTKTFDFGSFIVESSQRAFNIGEQGMKIMRGETSPDFDPSGPYLNGNNGDSFLNEHHRIMVESLAPGLGLSELNRGVLERVAASLNAVNREGETGGLYRWVRDVLTLATADVLYGPQSPVNNDHSLVDNLWDFEDKMTLLMLNFLPTIIAPKAYQGRIRIKSAFKSYYANNHQLTASRLTQAHLACCQKWGFTPDDIANFEISTLFLATTNSVPTSFWHLCNIVSSPALLEEIRSEVESIVTRQASEDNGKEEAVMDVTRFQTHCPLLVSTFHETLRLIDAATSVRAITAPTTLSSPGSSISYSLKSPAVVQLPSGICHTNPAIWGPKPTMFNPRRFLPATKASLDKETRQAQKQGYFPFGGGKHYCPGRHLAMMEILSLVAGLVVGFSVESLSGDTFRVPDLAFQKLGTAVRKPVRDVDVRLRRREGWDNVRWRFGSIKEGTIDFKAMTREAEE